LEKQNTSTKRMSYKSCLPLKAQTLPVEYFIMTGSLTIPDWHNLVQSTVENGGTMINYMGVTGLSKDNNGQLNGVIVKDEFTGKTYHVKGKVIVNATGVFTDDILNMNNTKHKKMVVPSQGIHLVLDKSFFPGEEALMIPKTSDGRVLFVVPLAQQSCCRHYRYLD
jgi:glycerol-3-phosphate dehydrogenase